jgi:hypothetical protein
LFARYVPIYKDLLADHMITFAHLDPPQQGPMQTDRPVIQKKRVLVGLVAFLCAIQIALATLYHYTEVNILTASFFTYRIDITGIDSIESFSPFSIIPALCAVLVTMWWEAIEKCCRELQPLIAMSRKPTPVSKGLNLSYSSSLWFWASIKAARNRHWILVSITIGSLLAQARKSDVRLMTRKFTSTNESTLHSHGNALFDL